MVYFTQGGITLSSYIKSFTANFSLDDISGMASVAPERFLGLSPSS